MAVDRVERRLRKVAAALDAASVAYAVCGGNAVAAWVASVDSAATRATKDVDLLVRRSDDAVIARVMAGLGFERRDLRRLVLYVDPEEPSMRSGVHLVWAQTLIHPGYSAASPSVEEAVLDASGLRVLSLPALVRMKLTSFRDIDRVHIGDLLEVGLIDEDVRASLPPELRSRLQQLEDSDRG